MTGPKSNPKEVAPMAKKQRKFSLGTEMLKKLKRKSGDQVSETTPDLLGSGNHNPTIESAISGDASDPINLCSNEICKPPLKDTGSIHKHLSQSLRIISTGFCKHVVYGGYIYKNRYVNVPQLHKILIDIESKIGGRLQTPDLTRSKITPENTPLLIIDARRPDEYAISHIPGAVNIHTLLARRVSRYLQNVDMTTPVLTYCAAGLRSGWLASRLRSLGFKNVKTLEGAFYQWASEGKPMVGDSGEIVYNVLPQHFLAAFLLEKQIRTVAKKAVEEMEEHLPIPSKPAESMHFSEPLFKEEKVESASVTRNHSITIC